MLKIEFDPSTLSKAQREDLASFILGWGSDEEYANLGTAITSNGETLQVTSCTSGVIEPGMKLTGALNGVIIDPKLAPLSADADPSRIALVDTKVPISGAVAPLPPVPQPGTPANTVAPQSLNPAEVDSKGMPWDERIHSSSKAKVAGGTWKYKRGVSDEEVKRVEGEITPYVKVVPHADAKAPFNSDNTDVFVIGNKCEPMKLEPDVVFTAPPPPSPTTAEPDLRKEFAQLMIRVAQAKQNGKITAEEVTAALAAHGVPSLPMLSTKLALVPSVSAAIDEIIASRG